MSNKPVVNSDNITIKEEGDLFRLWYTDKTFNDVEFQGYKVYPAGMGGLIDADTVLEGKVYIDPASIVLGSHIKDSAIDAESYVENSTITDSRITESVVKKSTVANSAVENTTLKKADIDSTAINNASVRRTKTYKGKIENVTINKPTYLIRPLIESEADIARGILFEDIPELVCYRAQNWQSSSLFSSDVEARYVTTLMYDDGTFEVMSNEEPEKSLVHMKMRDVVGENSLLNYLLRDQFWTIVHEVQNGLLNACVTKLKQKRESEKTLEKFHAYAGTKTLEEAAQYILDMPGFKTTLTKPDFRVVNELMYRITRGLWMTDVELKRVVRLMDFAKSYAEKATR